MNADQIVSQWLLLLVTGTGIVVASLWLGLVLWTWRDMNARSKDRLAQVSATSVVAALNIFGLIIYLMLRPRETLAEAYERSLEEEALLQGIEDKPVCPGCGRPSNQRWQVCPYCHTRLKKPCIACNEMLELAWNVCPMCATVQESAERRGKTAARSTGRNQRQAEAAPLEFVEGDAD
jgi:hypothetical protein